MGFVTPVLINNDRFHEIAKDPDKFVEEISELMNRGGYTRGHDAEVKMASHSSEFHLYAMADIHLLDLDKYNREFKEEVARHPEYVKKLLEKAKARIDEALSLFEEEKTTEIERRFIVSHSDLPKLRGVEYAMIEQGYIPCSEMVMRVRKSDDVGYFTLKGPKINAKCDEFEYKIPLTHAKKLLKKYCATSLTKKRYTIPHGDLKIELDIFTGNLNGLIIAEVELPNEDTPFTPPNWFGLEVTHMHEYSNIRLAERNANA